MPAATPPAFRLADGSPATGWAAASFGRRTAAWAIDVALFVATLGVGWLWWAWRAAAQGTTPGKSRVGLVVFSTDARTQATRRQMVLRGVVYQGAAALIGITTLGIGWAYSVLGALGADRRTLYDEWAQVMVLARPPAES